MDIPMAGAPAGAPTAPEITPERKAELDALVQEHDIVLFMKGTPEQPMCGFSNRAAQALTQSGHPFHAVNVFEGDPSRTIPELAAWAQFPTLPQIWVQGELVGGSDVILEMVENGELQEMLAD